MKYKTYKGKPTKYQRARALKQKKMLLLVAFITFLLGMAYDTIQVNKEVKELGMMENTQMEEKAHHEPPVASGEALEPSQIRVIELKTNKPEIETMIYNIADEMGRPEWGEYLVKLAYCESRLDPNAVNDKGNNPAHSKDRGLMQINDYWHSNVDDKCAFDPECSIRYTIKMIEQGRQREWICDKYVKGVPIELVLK